MTYQSLFAETVYLRGHQNDQIDAYFARPFGAGPYPGVVVIHHMPGWDDAHKEIGRRFAHHGYAAIVPNLHFREGKATPDENSASVRAAGGMPDDRTMGDVQAAINYLRELPYLNGKVGVIGFCSGGRQAYLAACTLRGIDATVMCYGGGVIATPEAITPRQPVPCWVGDILRRRQTKRAHECQQSFFAPVVRGRWAARFKDLMRL